MTVFTIEKINDIHDKLGKSTSLSNYLQALNAIGVERYDSFISDGHSAYYSADNQILISSPAHEQLIVADESNAAEIQKQLKLHEEGKTDYLQMSKTLADSGVEKWTFDTNKMTIAYYDKQGNELLLENLE